MNTKLIPIVLTLVVGIILAGSVLVPVLNDYGDKEKTLTNLGMPFAKTDDANHTITVDSDGITVDGIDIDLSLFPGNFPNYSIVYSEHGFIRWDKTNVMYSANKEEGSSAVIAQFDCATNTVTIAINGTDATISSSDATVVTRQISDVICYIAPEGDYRLSLNPYVTEDSELIAGGITVFTNPLVNCYIVWNGTIEEITAQILAVGGGYTATLGDVAVNTTAIHTDLSKIDSVTLDVTLSKDSTDSNVVASYTYFVVPATIEYTNPNYVGDTNSTLLATIPIMVIIALLMVAVGVVARRND